MYEWQDGPMFCTLMDREKDQPVAQVTKSQDRFYAWGLVGSLKPVGCFQTLKKAKEYAAAAVNVMVAAALATVFCIGLRAAEPPKPAAAPTVTDAQRALYWQAMSDLQGAQAAVERTITEMRAACEKVPGYTLGQGPNRQPACVELPQQKEKK